ncbi:MAG TPA: cytochrome P450 [Pseudonocardiaceae bacterium]|jgi:cytochrome P450|nr:cytochrome P450 [Pseudonocardiaceae bacterium]
MSGWQDARIGLMMLAGRTMVRTYAFRGDPYCQVMSRKPDADPYRLYERVRANGELSRSRLGMWATASHPLINTILRDQRLGVRSADDRSRDAMTTVVRGSADLVHPIEDSFLSMDPPTHTRLRRSVGPWFTPRALNQRADRIETIVDGFLDELAGRDEFDLIDDFAVRVPIQVICDLLGIPDSEYPPFVRWGAAMAACLDGVWSLSQRNKLNRAMVEMDAFFDEQIARRRREPGDDVISGLVQGTADAPRDPVQLRRDLVATAGLLLVAGFETTVNLIGNGVVQLLGSESSREWFRANPDKAPELVEEVLRLDPPVHQTMRIAHEPVELAGVRIPRDGMITLLLAGANRDPEVFTDPHRFDPTRANAREHLAFSAGIHYCLGAGLARIEGAVALRALFQRLPDLRQAGRVSYRQTRNIHGVRHLPVRGHAVRRNPAVA